MRSERARRGRRGGGDERQRAGGVERNPGSSSRHPGSALTVHRWRRVAPRKLHRSLEPWRCRPRRRPPPSFQPPSPSPSPSASPAPSPPSPRALLSRTERVGLCQVQVIVSRLHEECRSWGSGEIGIAVVSYPNLPVCKLSKGRGFDSLLPQNFFFFQRNHVLVSPRGRHFFFSSLERRTRSGPLIAAPSLVKPPPSFLPRPVAPQYFRIALSVSSFSSQPATHPVHPTPLYALPSRPPYHGFHPHPGLARACAMGDRFF